GVIVCRHDVASIVDAQCLGSARGGRRIIDRGEGAGAAAEESVKAGGVVVGSDDLAQVIYCFCASGVPVGQGFVDGGKDAAAQEKAVRAAGVGVIPHDLACIIDASDLGVLGGQG